MTMRLQELHPSLVHFPIALLPTSLAADAVGRLTGNQSLMEVGRLTIPLAAASGMVAGLAGLIAQEAVRVEGHTSEQLITHRNLNLGVIALTTLLASKRARRRRPSLGYLLAGLAGVAVTSYSAYLGGHMVYEHGVAVKAAGGVDPNRAPELTLDTAAETARLAGRLLQQGADRAAADLRQGRTLPWLTERVGPEEAASQPQGAPATRA